MTEAGFVPLPEMFDPGVPPEEAARRFYESMWLRRTVRRFSDRSVSRKTITWLVRTAGSAPSGANRQPWRFVCVEDPALKREIREAAEREEREFYTRRAGARWLKDLAPLGTDDVKEYLEVAPWLIVVFRLSRNDDGGRVYSTTPRSRWESPRVSCSPRRTGPVSLRSSTRRAPWASFWMSSGARAMSGLSP